MSTLQYLKLFLLDLLQRLIHRLTSFRLLHLYENDKVVSNYLAKSSTKIYQRGNDVHNDDTPPPMHSNLKEILSHEPGSVKAVFSPRHTEPGANISISNNNPPTYQQPSPTKPTTTQPNNSVTPPSPDTHSHSSHTLTLSHSSKQPSLLSTPRSKPRRHL